MGRILEYMMVPNYSYESCLVLHNSSCFQILAIKITWMYYASTILSPYIMCASVEPTLS